MVYTFAQAPEVARFVANVSEPVLAATVGATINKSLMNPLERGAAATTAGQATDGSEIAR